ncbi:hypothetical protein SISSUDRAFT_1122622 [Sistotremastrum suecicum HHB10207 ss-3]|uniref:Exocyst complex protein EXO70 n=2 Tax=Sistotremastraceae TaxID=3402574 RepID=A0A165Z3G2_9AGAM|nr:hypothetical protein SISSUDRAFT_1122622 [Sistotremastrum suecicum HHB10207 ss-3]
MEDEAEVELLDQHLLKTRQITLRMTSVLSKFDSRLIKLEKSIGPLYSSTSSLTRLATNIDATLESIRGVKSERGIEAEESIILRGPRMGELNIYIDAIEKLNKNILFQGDNDPEGNIHDSARLLETGTKKLCQLFTSLISSSSPPPTSALNNLSASLSTPPFPHATLQSLLPLISTLRSLPNPSTHPSHPSSSSILATLKEATGTYVDIRGKWARAALEGGGNVLDRVSSSAEGEGGVVFRAWFEGLVNIAADEYDLLQSLSPLPPLLPSSYSTLLSPLISSFTSSLNALTGYLKAPPRLSLTPGTKHNSTFLALDIYSTLTDLQPEWDDILAKPSNNNLGGGANNGVKEMKEIIQSSGLRGIVLRSFPELLVDIQTSVGGMKDGGTGVADITYSTVKYLTLLPSHQPQIQSALLTLGDGNWKMGAGMKSSMKKSGNQGNVGGGKEEGVVLLEHYTYDIIQTLVQTLTSLTHKRPPNPGSSTPSLPPSTPLAPSQSTFASPSLSSIFLLNNIHHLRSTLLLSPQSPIDDLLSPQTQDLLNSSYRTSKAEYLATNFSYLLSFLSDDGKSGGKGLKEKFTRFFDVLDEVYERHRVARVLPDSGGGGEGEEEREARGDLGDEVVRLVVPQFERFVGRGKEREFSKNPSKYIKMTPDEVERKLRDMYR